MSLEQKMTTTVIVVTLNRPDCVLRCLEALQAQDPRPEQVILVDGSTDTRTRELAARFADVLYLRNERGFGHMTLSRNIGLKHAIGDIIAFVDDDAYAHPGWLDNLVATYTDESVGGAGGRALRHNPGEETQGVDQIGVLNGKGQILGNFAADPGRVLEVDHIIGCNMSFRREVIERLGGFRDDYPGPGGTCEDTDMCLRVRRQGHRLLFNPKAVVDHVGAPQAKGSRGDIRYSFYSMHNTMLLYIRNFGPFSGLVWRFILYSTWKYFAEYFVKDVGRALGYYAANNWGTVVGAWSGAAAYMRGGGKPERMDDEAAEIRRAMASSRIAVPLAPKPTAQEVTFSGNARADNASPVRSAQ